jgi:hypothetical protein
MQASLESPVEVPLAVEARPPPSLEELLPVLVRKIAWSADARRGSLRLEFGAGALSGATLLVHADAGRVRVQLSGAAGADLSAWCERIAARLGSHGIEVVSVDVE